MERVVIENACSSVESFAELKSNADACSQWALNQVHCSQWPTLARAKVVHKGPTCSISPDILHPPFVWWIRHTNAAHSVGIATDHTQRCVDPSQRQKVGIDGTKRVRDCSRNAVRVRPSQHGVWALRYHVSDRLRL